MYFYPARTNAKLIKLHSKFVRLSIMDVRRIHEDINQLLIRLEEQYGRILSYENDAPPTIEMDLVLKDVRDLYECFIDLKTIAQIRRKQIEQQHTLAATPSVAEQAPEPKAEPAPVVASKSAEEPKPQPEPAVAVVEAKANTGADWQKTVEATPEVKPIEEPAKPAAPEKKAEARFAVEPPEVALPSEKPPVVAPKVDLLQERQKDFVPTVRKIEFKAPEPTPAEPKKESLFEKAASLFEKKQNDKTLASQASRQPISNIKAAIGINDKFSYLKELFKNNINEYNEALEKLNNFESYADAEDYFQELKAKYGWDPESKSFQGLADLLNRRYLHNA